jgi:hypothetical protein
MATDRVVGAGGEAEQEEEQMANSSMDMHTRSARGDTTVCPRTFQNGSDDGWGRLPGLGRAYHVEPLPRCIATTRSDVLLGTIGIIKEGT